MELEYAAPEKIWTASPMGGFNTIESDTHLVVLPTVEPLSVRQVC